jgi:UDP-N-acetylglucosamine 2-epimerase
MRAVFLATSPHIVEQFAPVIKELPSDCDSLVVNLDRWTRKAAIEQKLKEFGIKYRNIGGWSKRHVDKILQELQPDVLVMPSDEMAIFRLFIESANSRHIPTLHVLHGVYRPGERREALYKPRLYRWLKHLNTLLRSALMLMRLNNLTRRQLAETAWLGIKHALRYKPMGHGGCTKIAVFGSADKELFVSEGVSPESIVVTGNPKFDYLFPAKWNGSKSKICQRWGIPEDKDIVLLLTAYFVEDGLWTSKQREQFITAICQATSKLPQSKLVIKLHPTLEKEADYQQIIKELAEPPIICQNVPLPELLHACTLAITITSTAGLEAMAVGKPLVIANFFGDETLFDEKSGVTIINKEEDLLPALESILHQGLSEEVKEAASKFVYQHAYVQDGKAATRIADLIVQMASD